MLPLRRRPGRQGSRDQASHRGRRRVGLGVRSGDRRLGSAHLAEVGAASDGFDVVVWGDEENTMPSSIGLGPAISRVLAELQDGSLALERTGRTNAFVSTLRKARRRGHLMPDVESPRPMLEVA